MLSIRPLRPLHAASALLLAVLAACGGDKKTPVESGGNSQAPAAIAVSSGDNQSGMPNVALAAPVVARVTNAQGKAVSGTTVSFAVAVGGGAVASTTATTDADGRAQTSWTLGTLGVRQRLLITAGNAARSALANIDTTRVIYLSVKDTAAVGDTLRVWASAGLAATPGEAWGAFQSTFIWSDTSAVRAFSYSRGDPRMVFYNVFGAGQSSLLNAASFPENTAANANGGPRIFALNFVVKPLAQGKDVAFTLVPTALVGARTFTNLRPSVGVIGATVHVR